MFGQSYENYSLQFKLDLQKQEALKKREENFQLDNMYAKIEEYLESTGKELKKDMDELQRVTKESEQLLNESEEFERKRVSLNERKLKLQDQEAEYREELWEFSERIDQLANEIRVMNESIKDDESKIESLKNQIDICQEALQGDQANKSSEKQELLQLTNNLREANRNLANNQNEVSKLESKIQNLQYQIEVKQASVKEFKDQQVDLAKEVRENEEEEVQINRKIWANNAKIQSLNNQVERLRSSINSCKNAKTGLTVAAGIGSCVLGFLTGGLAVPVIVGLASTNLINVGSDYVSSKYQQDMEKTLQEKLEEEGQIRYNKQDLQNVQAKKRTLIRNIQQKTEKLNEVQSTVKKLDADKTSTEKTYSEKKAAGRKLDYQIETTNEKINAKNLSIDQLNDRIQNHKQLIADHQYNCRNQTKEMQQRVKELAALEVSKSQGEEKHAAVKTYIQQNHEEILQNNKESFEIDSKIEINSRNQKFLGRMIELKNQEIHAAKNDQQQIALKQHHLGLEIKASVQQQLALKRQINDQPKNRNNSSYNNFRR